MLNCDFKSCRFKPYYSPIFFFKEWVQDKQRLKRKLLKKKKKKKKLRFELERYSFAQDISSFFYFSSDHVKIESLYKLVKQFRSLIYYDHTSYLSNVYFFLKPLITVWNLRRAQLFVNFLNPLKETFESLTCGAILNILKQNGKSNRRKFKGFFLTFNYIKKRLTNLIRKRCLIFIFKKWRKINTYFVENFFEFFRSLKKLAEIVLITKPSFSFSKNRLKKKKSIKRRLTKKLVLVEKNFLKKDKKEN